MPLCLRCRVEQVSAESDVCLSCLDKLIDASLAEGKSEKQLAKSLHKRLSIQEAKRIIKDSADIAHIMASEEFASVLTDRQATADLRNIFIVGEPTGLRALAKYARRRLKRKRGRKPKGPEALYVVVYNLRKSGLTFGQIAKLLYGTPAKRNLAAAHYQRALKSGYPPVKPPSK
jgi:hypothetical protein